MKQESESPEYAKFSDALRKVLSVPHSQLKAKLDAEKRARARKKRAKVSAASRVPVGV
jgi:hypothetical protein